MAEQPTTFVCRLFWNFGASTVCPAMYRDCFIFLKIVPCSSHHNIANIKITQIFLFVGFRVCWHVTLWLLKLRTIVPMFWRQVVQDEDCDPSTCLDLLAERHSFISQETTVTRTTAARTHISLPSSCLFADLNRKLLFVVLCTDLQTIEVAPEKCEGSWGVFSWYQFETLLQDFRSSFVLSVWDYIVRSTLYFWYCYLSYCCRSPISRIKRGR